MASGPGRKKKTAGAATSGAQASATTLESLNARVTSCRLCPRLVKWREEVARTKRRAYRDQDYWGRPVPGFGDPRPQVLVVGLAPAAHGANRTGRMFTGDRSGDFLYAALHRAGFASQPTSVSRDDGLTLEGAFITNAARCAPPGNRPTPEEIARCGPYLEEEHALLRPRVLLALGAIAWASCLALLEREGAELPRPRPRFGHGAEVGGLSRVDVAASHGASGARGTAGARGTKGETSAATKLGEARPPLPHLIGSYHVSQQNTQTGRLTSAMFDRLLERVKGLAL